MELLLILIAVCKVKEDTFFLKAPNSMFNVGICEDFNELKSCSVLQLTLIILVYNLFCTVTGKLAFIQETTGAHRVLTSYTPT